MGSDINTRYNLKRISDNTYSLSISGSMRWVGGFVLFMLFFILLTLAFFIPIGFSINGYLKIVLPLFFIFTGIAVFAGYFFKKAGTRTFIFNTEKHTITQVKKTIDADWTTLQLPENGIIIRDAYKYMQKNLLSNVTTTGTQDFTRHQLVNVNRLIIIPVDNYSSKKDILEKISAFEKKNMSRTYSDISEVPFPENGILLSEGGFSEYQDLLIEGLIKVFNWELIDFLAAPPEIYDKEAMETSSLNNINIEKPVKVSLIKEKIKKKKIVFTINKMSLVLKFIILFFMAALSAFYAFFAEIKNDVDFWTAFFPIFSIWVIILSIKTKLYITEKEIYKQPGLFGIPILPKITVKYADIGDIKIIKENHYKLIFYKKGGKQTLLSVQIPSKEAGEYIIYKIVDFSKKNL